MDMGSNFNPLPLQEVPSIGQLSLDEVFSFYDFPRIFSAKNLTGQSFLAVCTFDDLNDDFEIKSDWLYVAISKDRLKKVKRGSIDLFNAFTKPEDGKCHRIELLDNNLVKLVEKDPSSVPIEDLPIEGTYLSLPLEQAEGLTPAPIQAEATKREVLDLHIEVPNIKSLEIPLSLLGEISCCLQALLDCITQNVMNKPSDSGRIPQMVLNESELRLAGIFEGSFGARLTSTQQSDLVDPIVADSLSKLIKLLAAKDDAYELRKQFELHNKRTASRYSNLLKVVANSKCDVGFQWASSNPYNQGESFLSYKTARLTMDVVNEMEEIYSDSYAIKARLTGWMDNTRVFEATDSRGEEYRGKISDDLFATNISPQIHAIYDMKIVDRTESNSIYESEKSTLILQNIRKIESPS